MVSRYALSSMCSGARSSPQALPCCSVTLGFCSFLSSPPSSFPLCPNTSSFSPQPSCRHPPWCRLLPPYFSPPGPSPPFFGVVVGLAFCLLHTPSFQLQGEWLGAASLVPCLRHLAGKRCLTTVRNYVEAPGLLFPSTADLCVPTLVPVQTYVHSVPPPITLWAPGRQCPCIRSPGLPPQEHWRRCMSQDPRSSRGDSQRIQPRLTQ